ncbi:hypothetical protein PAECIP111893_01824 [Paenibacillus plantiphilus]|uniref:Uncharacterized protein n=1 Tax=Paenibacillus plantiphilus TaxID=2905650 RepID=A0ABN8GAJ8_9BACL|nr:hypothetical protein [Paenibacillus plantiphilus]CAH1202535.1 hypothetical protein PAECIP111893_01824 [Paenibacillus plantiphilus]
MNEHEKYSLINNERGNVLLYCLLIVMVLMVVTPMVMMNVSTEKLTSTKMEDNIQVNTLASSAMEEFLNYIDTNKTITAIAGYKGWGIKKIRLPSGKKVELEQTAVPSAVTEANITGAGIEVSIKATSGNFVKEYKYLLKGTKGEIVVNPKFPIGPSPDDKLLISKSGHKPSGWDAKVFGINGLETAIKKYIDSIEGLNGPYTILDTQIKNAGTKVIDCKSCDVDQIIDEIKKSTENPVYIEANDIEFNSTGTYTFGETTKPVILKASKIKLNIPGAGMELFGNVVVGNITSNQQGSLYIRDVDKDPDTEQYGNLFVTDKIDFNKDADAIDITNLLYVGDNFHVRSSDQKITSLISAGSIVVKQNALNIDSLIQLTVTKHIAARRINFTSNRVIVTAGTDILASEYIQRTTGNGTFSMEAQGLIAAGGETTSHKGLHIQNFNSGNVFSGSGTSTILQCGGGEEAAGTSIFGDCSTGLNIEPKRR